MPKDPDRSAEIDAWFARLPADQRTALLALWRTVARSAPDAVETIGYAVPAFHYRGRALVSVGAARNHCSLFVQSPAVIEAHATELAGYPTSKGAVRFRPEAPLPEDLVTMLVRARMAEVDAALAR
ncbi:MAG TPA: DUF1801 domain-containing protein [Candidatus Deferrimicrobium sp.]|nr:DUF1801 domain-containing protein [Candidatus Deferrimicrobium sp.]